MFAMCSGGRPRGRVTSEYTVRNDKRIRGGRRGRTSHHHLLGGALVQQVCRALKALLYSEN